MFWSDLYAQIIDLRLVYILRFDKDLSCNVDQAK